MKRGVTETDFDHVTMANCLILLSRSGRDFNSISHPSDRVFECKTCNRQFSSFQALGGHRASHKKPRLIEGDDRSNFEIQDRLMQPKAKSHECSVCGLEFAMGQALGGHMRRHRAETVRVQTKEMAAVKKSKSGRVLWLDLNLSPSENDLNDLEFCFGKTTCMVDCFL